MNRTDFNRIAVVVGLVLGLMASIFAGTGNAQTALIKPASQVQDRGDPVGVDNAQKNSDQFGVASACGWNSPIYRHCGGNQFILVRVDFAWSTDEEDIWVTRGETNLVSRFGRSISYAWCVQNC